MDSAIRTEVKCQLPSTEHTQPGTVVHIHHFPSFDDTRSFLINSLNIQSCLNYKSTYSEPHWIFTSQEHNGGQQEADAEHMEQGCRVKVKRKHWLSVSPISIHNHCSSASPVLTAADTGRSIAFSRSTSIGCHHLLGRTDELNWNIVYTKLVLMAASWVVWYPFTSYSPFLKSSISNSCCLSPSFLKSLFLSQPPLHNTHDNFLCIFVPNSVFNTCLSLSCCCPLFFPYFLKDLLQTVFIVLTLIILK